MNDTSKTEWAASSSCDNERSNSTKIRERSMIMSNRKAHVKRRPDTPLQSLQDQPLPTLEEEEIETTEFIISNEQKLSEPSFSASTEKKIWLGDIRMALQRKQEQLT